MLLQQTTDAELIQVTSDAYSDPTLALSCNRIAWRSQQSWLNLYDINSGATTVYPASSGRTFLSLQGETVVYADSTGTFSLNVTSGLSTLITSSRAFQAANWGSQVVYVLSTTLPNGNPYQQMFLYDATTMATIQIDDGPTRNMNPSLHSGNAVWEHYVNWPNNPYPLYINLFSGGQLHSNISNTPSTSIAELAQISDKYVVFASTYPSSRQVYRYTLSDGNITQISSSAFSSYQVWPDVDGEYIVWQASHPTIGGSVDVMLFNGSSTTKLNPSPLTGNAFPKVSGNYVVWNTGTNTSHAAIYLFKPKRPAVRIQALGGATFKLSFGTETGITYQLQYSSDLITWVDVGDPISGNGSETSLNDNGTDEKAFWRVVIRL
jgi:hypothetical protein